jgi:hypothetical protein
MRGSPVQDQVMQHPLHAYYLFTSADGQAILDALHDVPVVGCAVKRFVGAIGPDELLRAVRKLDPDVEIVTDHHIEPGTVRPV